MSTLTISSIILVLALTADDGLQPHIKRKFCSSIVAAVKDEKPLLLILGADYTTLFSIFGTFTSWMKASKSSSILLSLSGEPTGIVDCFLTNFLNIVSLLYYFGISLILG